MVVVDRGKAHCQMVGMARKKDKLELLGSEIENEKWKKNDNNYMKTRDRLYFCLH